MSNVIASELHKQLAAAASSPTQNWGGEASVRKSTSFRKYNNNVSGAPGSAGGTPSGGGGGGGATSLASPGSRIGSMRKSSHCHSGGGAGGMGPAPTFDIPSPGTSSIQYVGETIDTEAFEEETTDIRVQLLKKEKEVQKLLAIIKQLSDHMPEGNMEALKILREDVQRREDMVNEREARVWGWRLVAAARDGELQRECEEFEERERKLREREQKMVERERALAMREAAIEQRQYVMNEEYKHQANQFKEELMRMRSKLHFMNGGGGVGGGKGSVRKHQQAASSQSTAMKLPAAISLPHHQASNNNNNSTAPPQHHYDDDSIMSTSSILLTSATTAGGGGGGSQSPTQQQQQPHSTSTAAWVKRDNKVGFLSDRLADSENNNSDTAAESSPAPRRQNTPIPQPLHSQHHRDHAGPPPSVRPTDTAATAAGGGVANLADAGSQFRITVSGVDFCSEVGSDDADQAQRLEDGTSERAYSL